MTTCTRIVGQIDIDQLVAVLQESVDRHPALRSVYQSTLESGAHLVTAPRLRVPTTVADLTTVAEEDKGPRVVELVKAQARAPFYLDQGPLLRASVLMYSPTTTVLALTSHLGLITKQGAELWRRLVLAKLIQNEWPEVHDYTNLAEDYAAWLSSEEAEARYKYWGEIVRGIDGDLAIPTKPRPDTMPWESASLNVDFLDNLWSSVEKMSNASGATPKSILLAAWLAVLQRYGGEGTVGVGMAADFTTPFSSSQSLHPVEHFQVYSSPSPGSSFVDLVKRVDAATQQGAAHSGVDWAALLERLEVERSLDRTAVFRVAMDYQPFEPLPQGKAVECSNEVLDIGVSRFELALRVQGMPNGAPAVALEYLPEIYDEHTVATLGRHFVSFLANATAKQEADIGRLDFLLDDEKHRQLKDWQGRELDYGDAPTHVLFAWQAERTPDNIAVVCGDERLTYAELNSRAAAIAAELKNHGIGKDVAVGILMEHAVDLLAAILGVMKAGGAYVPLDPEYPDDRLDFMLTDSSAKALIVATSELAGRAVADSVPRVVLSELDTSAGGDDVVVDSSLDSLAYIIYTSGSTGTPKGVEVDQRSIVDLAKAFTTRPGVSEKDVVATVAPFVFDMSVLTLFPPLTVGATVLLATREESRDGRALGAMLDRNHATMMKATPSTWRILVESGWAGRHELTAMTGGELFTPELARRLLASCGRLWNHYGPTEATAICTMFPVLEVGDVKSISIGSPLPNTRAYVLDSNRNLLPAGVPGELYIGGPCLARGYRNRLELTAERFVSDPFVDGARIYKTGDKVRYLAGGDIEFLGRFDNQVKVRGYRIELGEIEAKLRKQPIVKDTAVIVREDEPGDQRIVAYVVATSEDFDEATLRQELRKDLPAYMVPTAFVKLDTLPVNSRGKVDRRNLPKPSPAAAVVVSTSAKPPRDVTERKLVAIWESILKVAGISVQDDFFDLGGHSLLGMRLLAEIETTFKQQLPLSAIFQYRTIEKMSEFLASLGSQTDKGWHMVPINEGGSRPPIFFIPPLSGQITGIANLARCLGPDQPVFAVETWGEFGKHPFYTIESGAEMYMKRLTEVYPKGPFVLAGQSGGNYLAFIMAKKLVAAGRPPELLCIMDVGSPEKFVGYWTERPIEEGRYVCLATSNVIAQKGGFAEYRRVWAQMDDYAAMHPNEYWSLAVKEARASKVLPEDYSDERIRRFMRWMMWNAVSIMSNGIDLTPYSGQIALMRSDKPEAERPSLLQDRWAGDPLRGWGELSTQPVKGPYYVGSDHHHWSYLYREDGAALTAVAFEELLRVTGVSAMSKGA